jgi:hypothetical protein
MEIQEQTLELLADVVTVNVKHIFSPEELLQKSAILAQTVNDKSEIEAEKKAIASEYKNRIDKLQAEIKLNSGYITNGYAFIDKTAELYLDFTTNERVYLDKQNGEQLKREPFHPSDYQKRMDFTGTDEETDEQIAFNNHIGEMADPLGDIIDNKVKKAGFTLKPVPKDNLGEHYGKNNEFEDDDDDPLAGE